ncbi:caspase family protein [Bradyrhizobium sp. HKCCYLS2038]|uniref:caspase family protein n=1 Tax=unclassified Bradyrhizobium TaxID=2631580 RepID=UPI003EBA0FF5
MRGVSRRVRQLFFAGVAVVMAVLAGAGPAAADKRVALVIGNSIHEHAPLLDEPAADAKLLAETLSRLGFTLSGGAAQIDLTRQGFDRALAEFKGRIADADVALIYYAGYGLNFGGKNYLVPVDAAPAKAADVEAELRDLASMMRELEAPDSRQNVVILDAFRSNPFAARGIAGLSAGLVATSVPANTLLSFSAQPASAGQRGPYGHSAFATALAEAFASPDRAGLIETLNRAGIAVKRATAGSQQPLLLAAPLGGSEAVGPPRASPAPVVAEATNKAPTNRPSAGPAPASPPPSAPAAALDARTPGLAVLYDEDPADPKGKRYDGSVTWRMDTIKSPRSGQPVPAIRAEIDIPDRKLKVSLELRRNDDPTLPASHVADLTFVRASDFAGGGINSVPGILMKTNEQARGTPLAGLAVKVTEGSFLVGLSNVDADRARNNELLSGREWIDIPLVYTNQRRAILAISKGPTGDRVFADVFAAWDKSQPVQ